MRPIWVIPALSARGNTKDHMERAPESSKRCWQSHGICRLACRTPLSTRRVTLPWCNKYTMEGYTSGATEKPSDAFKTHSSSLSLSGGREPRGFFSPPPLACLLPSLLSLPDCRTIARRSLAYAWLTRNHPSSIRCRLLSLVTLWVRLMSWD